MSARLAGFVLAAALLPALLGQAPQGPLGASDRLQAQTGNVAIGGGTPLRLEEVLASVERSYPPLLVALQERALADADLLSAEGRFDVVFRARTDNDSLGFYSNRRFDTSVEQPLAFQGMSVFSGYRVSDGSFAPYDGKLDTRPSGEFRSGVRLPLLRDRAIDSRRADVSKARIGQQLANLSIDQQKLVIVQSATRRYWDWVAAGRRYAVAREVLDVALTRQRYLEEGVREGQIPAFDATDNQRIILQRRSQVVEAERGLQQASIELSLFHRDAQGNPTLPTPDRVPATFPAPQELTFARVEEDVEQALRRRPELGRLLGQRDQTRIDAALSRNQMAPLVDVVAGFTAEGGDDRLVRRGPQELRAALVFELPWQRRAATGRLRAAEARLTQIDQRERFTRDQIVADVQDALSSVRASFQRVELLTEEVRVTREVEQAERTRFELGEGTLFILNQREQATAEAANREVSAQADYQRALATYHLAIADALRPKPSTP